MAGFRIPDLPALPPEAMAADDKMLVFDTSTNETKAIPVGPAMSGLMGPIGPDGTVPTSDGGEVVWLPGGGGGGGGSGAVSAHREEITAIAGQTGFLLAEPYGSGSLGVYVNGVRLADEEYDDSNGVSVVLASPCAVGDIVLFEFFTGAATPAEATALHSEAIASAGQTTFVGPVGFQVGYLSVHVNGLLLADAAFNDSDGINVVLTTPLAAGDVVIMDGFLGVGAVAISAANITFTQAGTGAITRTVQDKLRERVSIADFGAVSDGTAAQNTAAIHKAMTYLMDRFPGAANYYPAGPGDPTSGGLVDFERRDRRTGVIYIPAGTYKVLPEVFSSLVHPRNPYVGFTFEGEDQVSSVLVLETGGVEAWFYRTSAGNERYQKLSFEKLCFMPDDYRFGNFAKLYSTGGPKQFSATDCRFLNFQNHVWTEGTGNSDLNRWSRCVIEHYGALLTLNNGQSVQHDYINCHFRSWGHQVYVKKFGGGNVNIKNSSMDFTWNSRFGLAGGNFMFTHDVDAVIGQGNCTYKWEDCRVEVEAYREGAADPPFGIVNCPDAPSAFPRVVFENVNFVNGRTYLMDASGTVLSSSFRRIIAVNIWTKKLVEFRNCVLLKNFFYTLSGVTGVGSPNAGGLIIFTDCYDGVLAELPAADTALSLLHQRVTYTSTAGRVITDGMTEHTTGSQTIRRVLDADPNWLASIAREPASTVKRASFKHRALGWPFGAAATNDLFLEIPPNLELFKIVVVKPAAGGSVNAYQLFLKANDRTGAIIASSTLGQFKDLHTIETPLLSAATMVAGGASKICLCATGPASDFANGGYAYIEYI